MDAETTYPARPERLERQNESDAIFARTLVHLERSRDYWQRRAMIAESELLRLRQVKGGRDG